MVGKESVLGTEIENAGFPLFSNRFLHLALEYLGVLSKFAKNSLITRGASLLLLFSPSCV